MTTLIGFSATQLLIRHGRTCCEGDELRIGCSDAEHVHARRRLRGKRQRECAQQIPSAGTNSWCGMSLHSMAAGANSNGHRTEPHATSQLQLRLQPRPMLASESVPWRIARGTPCWPAQQVSATVGYVCMYVSLRKMRRSFFGGSAALPPRACRASLKGRTGARARVTRLSRKHASVRHDSSNVSVCRKS